MPKPPQKNDRHQQAKKKKKPKSAKKLPFSSSMRKRGSKREVIFDPEARREYLRGASERKRQRRAFGLAMQKVKDRQAKIDQRAEQKKEVLQQIEQAEQQKEQLLEEVWMGQKGEKTEKDDDVEDDASIIDNKESDNYSDSDDDEERPSKKNKTHHDVVDTKVYDDKKTEQTWGGQVTVSVVQFGDDDDDDDDVGSVAEAKAKKKSVDVAQKYAGNVQRYLNELKGNMPGKHNGSATRKAKRKGKNGAAEMKGVGGSGNLKIASKLLNKSKDKSHTIPGKSNKKMGKKRRR
jgi:ribosomal RNA-processing protein 17